MSDFLTTLLPMFLFMLLPIWIPMAAVAFSWVGNLLRPRPATTVGVHRAVPATQAAG